MSARRGDWMQTRSGRAYWPLDPDPADVAIEDIAAHLSTICRYLGACLTPYWVAEHCVYASYLVPERLALHALLHDAPEAYVHDIIRPVKRHLPVYGLIEAANMRAISRALGLGTLWEMQAATIKDADNAMLLAEQAELMAPAPREWAPISVPADMLEKAHELLRGRRHVERSPGWAERLFLDRYAELA